MTGTAQRRRFAPRLAVMRDRAQDTATDRNPQQAAPIQPGTARSDWLGQSLPTTERAYFERRLGADLSSVRVHPDAAAATEMGARGFTVGHDIGVAPGQWRPGTLGFRRLLGHELTHVAQNR